MDRSVVIQSIEDNQAQLKAAGLSGVSLFGSTAREESSERSDVDLAVTLDHTRNFDLFQFASLVQKVTQVLGVAVDLVVEPSRNARLQAQIDRDRLRVY